MNDDDDDARGFGRRDSTRDRSEPSRASSGVLARGVVGAGRPVVSRKMDG
jgi:hypothetical protein